jgi:hypothetical protein
MVGSAPWPWSKYDSVTRSGRVVLLTAGVGSDPRGTGAVAQAYEMAATASTKAPEWGSFRRQSAELVVLIYAVAGPNPSFQSAQRI